MQNRIFILMLVLSSIGLMSQAQTSFGLRAGVNFTNINGKADDGSKFENKMKTGFHVGATADIPVAPDFYIQPGALFSTKGSHIGKTDGKWNLSYLEIPVNLLYKPVLGSGRLLLGFGPYYAFAIGGNVKQGTNETDITFKNEITVTESATSAYMKRGDAGANLLAGYELSSKISFQLNAQLGLLNLRPETVGTDTDKGQTKNTGFGVSVGYKF